MVASPNETLDQLEGYLVELRQLQDCLEALDQPEDCMEVLDKLDELLGEELAGLTQGEKRRKVEAKVGALQNITTSLARELENMGCYTQLHHIFEASRAVLTRDSACL